MHEMSEKSSTATQEGFLGCEEDKEREIESKTMMKVTQSVISPSMELLSTHMGTQMVGFRKCCQADECGSDLSDAKRYYKRHKVCERHAKAPVVLVKQIRQRFCQQCSKFHEISKFDYTKRSCRDRLADHNERRRKSQIDPKDKEVKDNMRIRELVVKKHLKHFLNLNEVSVQMSPSSSASIDAIASSSFNAGGLSHPNGGPNLGEMSIGTSPPPNYQAFSNVMNMMAAHQARTFF